MAGGEGKYIVGCWVGTICFLEIFEGREMICIYLGSVVDSCIDSIYSITMNGCVTLDTTYVESDAYLRCHMVNGPNWNWKVAGGGEKLEFNAMIGRSIEFIAEKTIEARDETFIDYNYNYS